MCENCSIPKNIIFSISKIPSCREAIGAAYRRNGGVDDREFYKTVRDVYFNKIYKKSFGSNDKKVRQALKDVSECLYGDKYFWVKELPEELYDIEQMRQLNYHYSLSSMKVYKVFQHPELLKAFWWYGVFDDSSAYSVCEMVLFQIKEEDFDFVTSEKISEIEKIVEDYARALGMNPKSWQQDYQEFLETRTFTIRKASRNGGYEKVTVTEDEAARMLQHDERLEDVDEDL